MIDPSKALSWLNAIDKRSHLNHGDCRMIEEIGQSGLSDLRIAQMLEKLRADAHSSNDPLRTAEIMLCCASVGHWRRTLPQAARDAIEAVISYDADNHRRAVALWILGIIQWEMSQNHDAYRTCAEARKIFQQRQNVFVRSRNAKDWYNGRIEEIEIELIARPEEISTWLNRFESSSLGSATQQIITSMREKIRRQAYPSIYVLMQDLQEASRRSERIYERGEVYLEFGLAMHQMGNSHFAMELLRKAVRDFYPGVGTYHKQLVARCMLGAVEWMQELSLNQAAADWLSCVDELENLCWGTDRDHLQEKVEWYTTRWHILRCALRERVRPPEGSDLDTDHPNEIGLEYKTYPYDDLLSKVLWDHATADRLIEFQHQKMPTAARNELIRRAIERCIQDNQ